MAPSKTSPVGERRELFPQKKSGSPLHGLPFRLPFFIWGNFVWGSFWSCSGEKAGVRGRFPNKKRESVVVPLCKKGVCGSVEDITRWRTSGAFSPIEIRESSARTPVSTPTFLSGESLFGGHSGVVRGKSGSPWSNVGSAFPNRNPGVCWTDSRTDSHFFIGGKFVRVSFGSCSGAETGVRGRFPR